MGRKLIQKMAIIISFFPFLLVSCAFKDEPMIETRNFHNSFEEFENECLSHQKENKQQVSILFPLSLIEEYSLDEEKKITFTLEYQFQLEKRNNQGKRIIDPVCVISANPSWLSSGLSAKFFYGSKTLLQDAKITYKAIYQIENYIPFCRNDSNLSLWICLYGNVSCTTRTVSLYDYFNFFPFTRPFDSWYYSCLIT